MLLSRVDEQRLIALTRNLRRHSREEVVDERAAQADRLEIIAAAIGGDHRDPHFGEDFEQTVVDRLAETQAAVVETQLAEQAARLAIGDRRLGQIRSEEHTSELQSLMRISYAVFCLKKKKQPTVKSETS